MIVRTYTRRSRPGPPGRTLSDPPLILLDSDDSPPPPASSLHLSQDSCPLDPVVPLLPFSSSQDSSPWSLDIPEVPPSLPPPPLLGDSSNALRRRARGVKRGSGGEVKDGKSSVTATLMEAQEFGEMMEHIDEVNFALDGLRPGQPGRIRRSSLLALLSVCGSAQQRRLLRAQGMAKRMIDAILGLSFDDSPSTVAAAALFFVLASDIQDDHLLDSPSCIQFLLKLLNPPAAGTAEEKLPYVGSRLLGIRKPSTITAAKALDSSSAAIVTKVREILLNCKEIKSSSEEDEGQERPELSSKWIALLTMEKACLSNVSFEDTSDTVRRVGGNFKERLRELGGLDAIFDVVTDCHSSMEGWLKQSSSSVLEIKDGVALKSVVVLLKCLKIMENATFLSKDNQNHLLGMKTKSSSQGLAQSFVGVIISSIKFLSDLSLLQSSSSISSVRKSISLSKSLDSHFSGVSELNDRGKGGSSSSNHAEYRCMENVSPVKSIDVHKKRQRMFASESEPSISASEMTVASGTNVFRIRFPTSVSCNGPSSVSNGVTHRSTNGLSRNSDRGPNGWISMQASGSKMTLGGLSKKPHLSTDVKYEGERDSPDPFAFDEDDLEPSKWELLAMKKETSQTFRSTRTIKFQDEGDFLAMTADDELNQLGNGGNDQCHHKPCQLVSEEDSTLLEDCLLTAVKVLMNLTNDNNVGCQQIAACGGLDTLASLIISHFPSFDLCYSMHGQLKDDISSSETGRWNNKHLSVHELDFLVAILGLLVNLVEKDNHNRSRLVSARVSVNQPGKSKGRKVQRDVIPILCSIFLANQGAGEAAGEGRQLECDDEASLLQGEREAEMMIIEAYASLLLAFLSTESIKAREAIASCLPNHNLQVLVPVLERFVAFHLSLNMISPETHSAVSEVIESCKAP